MDGWTDGRSEAGEKTEKGGCKEGRTEEMKEGRKGGRK
jgi:hypothetical protein